MTCAEIIQGIKLAEAAVEGVLDMTKNGGPTRQHHYRGGVGAWALFIVCQ